MSVSIYHFPTPNGFVSVVGSANLSLGYSTAQLDTLFVTVGERVMGGPQNEGNVTMRTIATFGTLSQKTWVGDWGEESHMCLLQALTTSSTDSGQSGVFHPPFFGKLVGFCCRLQAMTLSVVLNDFDAVHGLPPLKAAELQHVCAEEDHRPSGQV